MVCSRRRHAFRNGSSCCIHVFISFATIVVLCCLDLRGLDTRFFALSPLESTKRILSARPPCLSLGFQCTVLPGLLAKAERTTHVTRQAAVGALWATIAKAASAGAVAACVQAALFAITEPIVNRVNVERMTIRAAALAVTPGMMINHLKTTLPTSLIKAPFYEAVVTLILSFPLPPNVQGLMIGVAFTTCTMPLTNFRARMSLQQSFGWSDMYTAYIPTVIRDIVGGIARTRLTMIGIHSFGMAAATPKLMFWVVLCSCLISAPFNEIRAYFLQRGKRKPFEEFFQPMNCIRSTLIGAFNFGLSYCVGYALVPLVGNALRVIRGG